MLVWSSQLSQLGFQFGYPSKCGVCLYLLSARGLVVCGWRVWAGGGGLGVILHPELEHYPVDNLLFVGAEEFSHGRKVDRSL